MITGDSLVTILPALQARNGHPRKIRILAKHGQVSAYIYLKGDKTSHMRLVEVNPGRVMSISNPAAQRHVLDSASGWFATRSPFDAARTNSCLSSKIAQSLNRRTCRHVLLVGERGVDQEAIVIELAGRTEAGELAFLNNTEFMWLDARLTSPHESGARLAAVMTEVCDEEQLVICVNGLPALLRGANGMDHRLFLLSRLQQAKCRMIAPMTPRQFEELTSDLPEMLEFFNQVDVPEPDVEETLLMMFKTRAAEIGERFGVEIEVEAVRQAVVLSANYILNECLPGKAVKVLNRCCELVEYERACSADGDAQQGHPCDNSFTVTSDHVVAEVSRISGVPEETLRGIAEQYDYETSLGEWVVGQDEAVREVATELGLIKAGLVETGKPSVMLFVGQTGTGKTELAKALARFYSTTKRLQTYTLGNFVEPHSVSGIIGVPPGYVGHNLGGRLVNELNADPYCVVLLDEADKAHPDVLQPFLNLFDEGWLRDQRGAKAYGDKAIFILTTNVAQKMIADMARQGKGLEEIREKVIGSLSQIRHSKANRPVFSPEFLARIKRIIVFQPLDQPAMQGICRKLVREMAAVWREKREKTLDVPEALMEYIAELAHHKNRRSNGREGGRIVRKLLTDLVEANIQRAATARPDEYRACSRVAVECQMGEREVPDKLPPKPDITVRFDV